VAADRARCVEPVGVYLVGIGQPVSKTPNGTVPTPVIRTILFRFMRIDVKAAKIDSKAPSLYVNK
jgi:hypothetical protein